MDIQPVFDQAYAEKQLHRAGAPLRGAIRQLYVSNTLKDVNGPAIDFGCGAGLLLRRLPPGSMGLEVNPHLVENLRQGGLDVRQYDPSTDQFLFRDIPENRFKCFVMLHVLEHIADAASVLRALCRSCNRLGIDTIIIAVPGLKGYATDATHETFVDLKYLREHDLLDCEGYSVARHEYFPVNLRIVGDYFVHNEFKFVYRRAG